MGTPHNQAEPGQIAKSVLMPGDPLRAKFIAETFLDQPKLVNEVRNILAYTGSYRGEPVTVMASGMGMPSIGIYSYELFKMYDVDRIIRVGSSGAYVPELKLYDVVMAESAWSETSYARAQNGCEDDVMYPSESLNKKLEKVASKLGIPLKPVRVHSSDVFYHEDRAGDYTMYVRDHQCACVEMESFALFHNARVLHKEAACLLTISDSFPEKAETTAEERQNSFTNMMKIALEACL